MKTISIKSQNNEFLPFQIEFKKDKKSLSKFLSDNGLKLNTNCGGKGKCRGCKIDLQSSTSVTQKKSCQLSLNDLENDQTIIIPASSLWRNRIESDECFKLPDGFEAEDSTKTKSKYAIAIDLGTTSVAFLLFNYEQASIVRCISVQNPQIRYGDNVMARIEACVQDEAAVGVQQEALLEECIKPMVQSFCDQLHINPRDIDAITVAGNPTMLHILTGINPAPLGTYPFKPVFLGQHFIPFKDIVGIDVSRMVEFLPGFGAFVGSDVMAGVFASGMNQNEETCLLIDLGTNGEVVLRHNDHYHCCATAVGPAFEGGRLLNGSRAVAGAIGKISIQHPQKINFQTIIGEDGVDHHSVVGICGTAYIDFIAEAYTIGLLNERGRFSETAMDAYPDCFDQSECKSMKIHKNSRSDILISEIDIAELLQAKAAIAGGLFTLLNHLSLQYADIDKVFISGGFGKYLNVKNAKIIGLLPSFDNSKIHIIGNSSLAGAYMCLSNPLLKTKFNEIVENSTCYELNHFEDFEDYYVENLMIGCADTID